MFKKIGDTIENILSPIKPIPVGAYQFQGEKEDEMPYRLNLRIEPSGNGILIINASTVLHLNRTAAEYAYHLVKRTSQKKMIEEISEKFDVSASTIRKDFKDFIGKLDTLVNTPDLDPVTYLDIDRVDPYSKKISAPYRLDCALTYQVSDTSDKKSAPVERVSREITTEEWLKVLQKVADIGIPHVVFTGGEPTLREDLPALIEKTEELGIVSSLLSDGLKFKSKKYLKTILDAGLDHIMLLVDDQQPDFWASLKNLIKDDIAVTAHFTLTKKNKGKAVEVIDKLSNEEVNTISLSTIDTNLKNELEQLQYKVSESGMRLTWDLPVPYSQYNPIAFELQNSDAANIKGAGKAWLYVEPDGDVLPTQGINKVLGNILHDPWPKIWKGSK